MCKNMIITAPAALIIGSIIGTIGVFLQLSLLTVLAIATATGMYVEFLGSRGYFDRLTGGGDSDMGTEYQD